jgi:MFS family permease
LVLFFKKELLSCSGKETKKMDYGSAYAAPPFRAHTKLNRQQIVGFWAAWFGWMLDGMDSVIYALVLGPALTELLPRSGIAATHANIGYSGSLMFALFLVGWGLSFIWGPISDSFGRTKTLAATVLIYAVFTGAAALSPNVWVLAGFSSAASFPSWFRYLRCCA